MYLKDRRKIVGDQTTVENTVLKQLEQEAINLYRAAHPQGPAWQELHFDTRHLWVVHAEKQRGAPRVDVPGEGKKNA